jgi:uncharacterized RDD family membrane protein YckC
LLESSAKQATLGKLAAGIRVADTNGNRISRPRATVRWLVQVIPASWWLLGSGWLFARGGEGVAATIMVTWALAALGFIGAMLLLVTPRRQAIHDLVARTVVLNARD